MATRGRSAELHARTTFYYSNGTGRDTYILHNSGGMVKTDKLMPRPSSALNTSFQRPSSVQRNRPRIDGRSVHYHSDGSGRDKYIGYNAGGFSRYSEFKSGNFFSTLRDHDRIKTNKMFDRDYFNWAQNFRRNNELKQEKMKSGTIRNMLNRLTKPIVQTFKDNDLRKLNPPEEYRYMGHKLDRSFF